MKIISSNPWQPQVTNAAGKPAAAAAKSGQAPAAAARDDTKEPRGDTLFLTTAQPQRDPAEEDEGAAITRFLKSLEKSDSHSSVSAASQGGDSQGGFQIKSSNKGESVGQLAALLSRAETRLDVLQVSSKVTRILMDLKASAAGAKGDEAKKLARQIKRYEKLMKRIEKKLKHLAKEEQLELRRKRALKQMEFEKEQELRQELKNRRAKRRKDEKNYAAKQIEEDRKTEDAEMAAAMTGGSGSSPLSDALAFAEGGGIDLSALGGDAVSFDSIV